MRTIAAAPPTKLSFPAKAFGASDILLVES
jgi:hypothetical protein